MLPGVAAAAAAGIPEGVGGAAGGTHVDLGDTGILGIGQDGAAAAGVADDGVIAHADIGEIVAHGADGADLLDGGDVGIHGQATGGVVVDEHLEVEVGFVDAGQGQGRLDVVDGDGHESLAQGCIQCFTGEGVGNGGLGGCFRRRLRGGIGGGRFRSRGFRGGRLCGGRRGGRLGGGNGLVGDTAGKHQHRHQQRGDQRKQGLSVHFLSLSFLLGGSNCSLSFRLPPHLSSRAKRSGVEGSTHLQLHLRLNRCQDPSTRCARSG